MHEFEEKQCTYCGSPEHGINLDGCLICETFQGACPECIGRHREKHSKAEMETFKREMMDEPPLTIRERINLELKEQIRHHAETLCKLIDDQELLIKQHESQCRLLAEELDRRITAS
jgi:hypothetical protein